MLVITGLLFGAYPGSTHAVEVTSLKDMGFDAHFGRYAPKGDCTLQPQFVMDASGFAFEINGKPVKTTTFEYAASYGGNFYEGISVWFFPFKTSAGYPILMTFNSGETKGVVTIDAQDEGWKGGPPLSPVNAALVKGSPYARCK